MAKVILTLLVVATFLTVLSGCQSTSSGSREFIPGRGWVPND